jgi:glycerol-3-phosphate dehydrogenase (NAD(P)+)
MTPQGFVRPNIVCVLGGGAYGTAMAQVIARQNYCTVKIWAREEETVNLINTLHENKSFLKGVKLSLKISATSDIEYALKGAELVLLVIPTPFLRSVLVSNRSLLPVGVPLVCCSKGIETSTLQMPYEICIEELPGKYHPFLAILSGPSFAEETANGQPTSVLVASLSLQVATSVQYSMSDDSFRVYTGCDMIGAELAGAVKNVVAIACGAASGYGFGSNTAAMLMSRGLIEMTRLAAKKGALASTMMGLAGVGDLVLTCTSKQSRNFTVGVRIAKGETLNEIQKGANSIAEGVTTSLSLHLMAKKLNVEMPICEEVYQVLHHGKPFIKALEELKARPLGPELEGFEHDIHVSAKL